MLCIVSYIIQLSKNILLYVKMSVYISRGANNVNYYSIIHRSCSDDPDSVLMVSH